MKLEMVEKKLTDEKLYNDSLPFDIMIEGKKRRNIKYTHGSIENGKYVPKFLTFIGKKCQDFFILGSINAKKWLATGQV